MGHIHIGKIQPKVVQFICKFLCRFCFIGTGALFLRDIGKQRFIAGAARGRTDPDTADLPQASLKCSYVSSRYILKTAVPVKTFIIQLKLQRERFLLREILWQHQHLGPGHGHGGIEPFRTFKAHRAVCIYSFLRSIDKPDLSVHGPDLEQRLHAGVKACLRQVAHASGIQNIRGKTDIIHPVFKNITFPDRDRYRTVLAPGHQETPDLRCLGVMPDGHAFTGNAGFRPFRAQLMHTETGTRICQCQLGIPFSEAVRKR